VAPGWAYRLGLPPPADLRILYTLTSYPPSIGGAQLHTHRLACELRARHSIQVVTQWQTQRSDWLLGTTLRAPPSACSYELDGVAVRAITLTPQARRRLAPWVVCYYALQGPALARIADALAAELAPWGAQADVIHNCRIGREGLSYASLKLARQRRIPFVLTPVHHPRWAGWLHRYYHRLYRMADAVIALTEAERRTLVALGVAEDRVAVTGVGPILADSSDPARFRARHGLSDDPVVLFLGQKYAYKGVGALLTSAPKVWRRAPETRFVFVGPRTPYSRRLFAGVADHRILELDAVGLEEKTDAIAACDILCLPSSQESFGGVFTEAWALGKPVVGCDIAAVRAVVDNGADGLLTLQRPEAIADALLSLLDRPKERAEMGERGRRKVADRYLWSRLAATTERVYQQALTRCA